MGRLFELLINAAQLDIEHSKAEIQVSTSLTDSGWFLCLSATGKDDPAIQDRIFDPFLRRNLLAREPDSGSRFATTL